MKITIIENETYLAASILNKLSRCGFEVEVFHSIREVSQESYGDIYLVSANLPSDQIIH